jgi:4'-phosphopantetheinyl transferase
MKMEDSKLNGYLELLPPVLKDKVKQYRKWEDGYTFLFGKLLTLKGFEAMGLRVDLNNLKHNSFGKPYFENLPDFNVTHSGNLVACALAIQGKVGLDAEALVHQEYKLFKDIFRPEEWEQIESANEPMGIFYSIWTIKEAITKAIGNGLNTPLKKITIHKDFAEIEDKKWYYQQVNLSDGYLVHLASNIQIKNLQCEKINFYE